MEEQIIEKDGKRYKVIEVVDDTQQELFWGKYTIDNIEEAKKDKDSDIRRVAYRVLGYTQEAKKDKDPDIRREAELYFKIQESSERLERDEKREEWRS